MDAGKQCALARYDHDYVYCDFTTYIRVAVSKTKFKFIYAIQQVSELFKVE